MENFYKICELIGMGVVGIVLICVLLSILFLLYEFGAFKVRVYKNSFFWWNTTFCLKKKFEHYKSSEYFNVYRHKKIGFIYLIYK